ncbi:hypothetical protein Nepgr_003124 [Nepenthes gracilis]|uniref:Pentatricopeptide repeat-containing protein n=1 Tax=Nepenthes gracilis TaxID=150966 RepID=A0AAD3RZ12_NEPGR|nr:hypothetical protein Nepgr_003124 [Nepenthes gracilis]
MKLSESVGFLLHRCSDLKALRAGLSLHAAVLKSGMQSHTVVANHVINMYAKCGRINSAHQVFDEMRERNLVSWAALICGYDQSHEPLVAIQLYSRMPLAPNEFVLASVISACASVGSLVHGQRAHARALKLGYAPISFVSNALISLYMKCGLCDGALAVFGCSTLVPNSISHNTLLAGFVENGQPARGLEVFESMCRHGFIPDRFSFAGALGACTDAVNLQGGLQLHCQTMKLKLDSTAFVGNTIMSMYSKFDLIEQVEKVFMEIEEKDIISWNTLIAACSQCDNYLKGLSFFKGC